MVNLADIRDCHGFTLVHEGEVPQAREEALNLMRNTDTKGIVDRFGYAFLHVDDPKLNKTEIAPGEEDFARGQLTGRAYVFSGVDGSELRVWTGEAAGEGFGVGRGAGDVNFDGHADVVVSAWRSQRRVPFGERAGRTAS